MLLILAEHKTGAASGRPSPNSYMRKTQFSKTQFFKVSNVSEHTEKKICKSFETTQRSKPSGAERSILLKTGSLKTGSRARRN